MGWTKLAVIITLRKTLIHFEREEGKISGS